jgi:hypothetical protein
VQCLPLGFVQCDKWDELRELVYVAVQCLPSGFVRCDVQCDVKKTSAFHRALYDVITELKTEVLYESGECGHESRECGCESGKCE